MTEAEWLACDDREAMLAFLKRRGTKRKLRLFSVACCQRIWPLIQNQRSRAAVLMAERFADAQATSEELQAAEAEAKAVWLKDPLDDAAMACFHVCTKEVAGLHASGTAIRAAWRHRHPQGEARRQEGPLMAFRSLFPAEEAEQCRLIRDIFGNPFRPLPPRKGKRAWQDQQRQWLAWQDRVIPNMAQTVYEDRAYDRMPILADALEDAGCAAPDLLGHLRSPGPHARGCWALDLILGRE